MIENDNKIEITNNTGDHLTFLDDVLNPSLFEQINAGYMFSFAAFVDDNTQYIRYENLVTVEGQKFEIARITKKRGEYPKVEVECDHISYRLNRLKNLNDFDDTPTGILTFLLRGTGFSVGTVEFPYPIYFKPGDKSIRECIIELAGFIGGEVVWDNFTVSIVDLRGVNDSLQFNIGENVKEFSHEVDYTAEEPFTAVELDVIDLSRLEEFEGRYGELEKIHLGDKVRLRDPLLGIDETQRVVSYERNPFDKSLPKISIGNVPRLFTDYGDREGKDSEDDDDSIVVFRGEGLLYVGGIGEEEIKDPEIFTFKVGNQEILDVEDSNFTDEIIYDLEVFHPFVFVEKKAVRTIIRVSETTLKNYTIIVKNGEDSYMNFDFKGDTLTIIGKFPNDLELYVYDGEAIPENIVKAYGAGVIVEENNDGDDEYREWMTSLTIAGENVLAKEGLNKTHEAQEGSIKSPPIVEVTSQWGDFILEVPKDKMRDYYIRVSAMNLINGRSIRTYNKNGFSDNKFRGAGWGPFVKDRETARYVIQFRTDNTQDGSGIVRAFSFNATLTLPEDLDEWPSEVSEDGYFIEFGKAKLSSIMIFDFNYSEGYDEVYNITTGLNGTGESGSNINIVTSVIYENNKAVGVKAVCRLVGIDATGYDVSMNAMCKKNKDF